MQVIGTKAVHPAISEVAERASRLEVTVWLERALRKTLKRGPARHLRAVVTASGLKNAMKADDVPQPAAGRIIKAFEEGEEFLVPDKRGVGALFLKAMEVLDWFDSMPDKDRHLKRIDRISWDEAVAASDLWHRRLAGRRAADIEVAAGDVETIHEFDDGCRVADLLTPNALKQEGARMVHCVGGYWNVVESGTAKILSIRDLDNSPHVTIELRRPPSIVVQGYGRVFVDRKPGNGVRQIRNVNGDWQAVQIRGKQNRPPVEKWAKKVSDFLTASGLGVRDPSFRHRTNSEDGIIVYAVNGAFFSDSEVAAKSGEAALGKSRSSQKFSVIYRVSGLAAVHGCIDDGRRVVDFLLDDRPLETETTPLISISGKGLQVKHHHVSLRPLMAITHCERDDVFSEVVSKITPGLEALVSSIEENPGTVHVIKDRDGTFGEKDIKSAILMCGFGQRFADAIKENERVLRISVSDARLKVKRARQAGAEAPESINHAMNLLSDGFENRIHGFVKKDKEVICAFDTENIKDSSRVSGLALAVR